MGNRECSRLKGNPCGPLRPNTINVTMPLDQHISKGYIYFAMAFSVFVEMINSRLRAKAAPVKLHQRYPAQDGAA